jgi:hypothetical protein
MRGDKMKQIWKLTLSIIGVLYLPKRSGIPMQHQVQ